MTEACVTEKRKDRRYPVDFVVLSKNPEGSSQGLAFIRDISKSGMRIQALCFPFRAGERCCLHFFLDKDRSIQLNAEVRWTRENATYMSQAGVCFDDQAKQDAQEVIDYISQYFPQSPLYY